MEQVLQSVKIGINEKTHFQDLVPTVLGKYIIEGPVFFKNVFLEYSKSFPSDKMETQNKGDGSLNNKRMVNQVSTMVKAFNGNNRYSSSLASSILKDSLHLHLPKDQFRLCTNCHKGIDVTPLFTQLVFHTLNTQSNG